MEPWRTSTRIPKILDALGGSEDAPSVRQLGDALGGAPSNVSERLVGEPAYRSRRLRFASGGELVLHDGAVVSVMLPAGELSEWIPDADASATLDDLKTAIGAPRKFAGFGTPYFSLDGGYARADFRDRRGWNDPGNLLSITISAGEPGLSVRPEDDDCPTCSDLLVRTGETNGGLDTALTVDALTAALADGAITEDAHWVPLADLQLLHASRLMERVESQLTCTTCRRIICFTLHRDAPATFQHSVTNDAMRRPMEAIPPVEQWGDAARIAEERDAMHYVDHEPAAWFLVEQRGVLYIQARYVVTSMVDDSALIELEAAEVEAYRAGGHAFVSALAGRIHDGSPHLETSAFYARDLFRGSEGKAWRDAAAKAIVNHTWIAQQRRSR